MDNFGDYIYLIIIIIAGLSGLLKKRKDNQTKHTPVEEDENGGGFEDVLRELLPEREDLKPEPIPAPVSVYEPIRSAKVTGSEFVSYETTNDISSLKAKKQVTSYSPKQTLEVESEKGDLDSLNVMINDADDARQAFIYSEVFNRKY
jgi:hypothetical protein